MSDEKICDEFHRIANKHGNGQLGREVWANHLGQVTRYNLAYINHRMHQNDNGRVIGYGNQDGFHHRHYFGKIEKIVFTSFEDIEVQFQQDWLFLRS